MGRTVLRQFGDSWRRAAKLLVLAAVSICVSAGGAIHAAGLESYRLATGYYQRKKWDLAAEEFRSFLKDLPKHPKAEKAEVFLGMSLVNLKEFDDARRVFRDFISKYPESRYLSHAMYRVGECSFLLDDHPSAEKELAAFLDKFSDDPLAPRATYNLAETKLSLEQPDDAIKLYQSVLKPGADQVLASQAKLGLAKAFAQAKKYQQAEQLYNELIGELTGAEAAAAGMQLADLLFDRQDYEAASVAYGRLVEKFPDNPDISEARLKLGMSLFGTRKFLEAAEQLGKIPSEDRQIAEAEFWHGASLKSAGKYEQAAELLKANYERLGESPKAPRTLYQWADSEQRAGRHEEARVHFLELVRRWPQHTLADDALHAAALSALKAQRLDAAQELMARFSREYATSGLRYRQKLLQGRLWLATARQKKGEDAAALFEQASQQFREVMQESTIEATQRRARYFLAYAAHELGNVKDALTVIQELTAALDPQSESADETYLDAYVLQALCQFKLEDYESAAKSASVYLAALQNGEYAAQALAIRARSAAKLGNKQAASADQAELQARWPKTDDYARATKELAEIAYANEDFQWAAQLSEQLAQLDSDSRYRADGLIELGWSHYKHGKKLQAELKQLAGDAPQRQQIETEMRQGFEAAAKAYATFTADYPKHALVAEAGFQQGICLSEQGKLEDAVRLFKEVFQNYGPSDKGFLAGLEAARHFRAKPLNRIDDADSMYQAVIKKYPNREDGDQLLREWAVMHYNAENYQRSDALYRQLLQQYPDSQFAADARLDLGISDLLAGKMASARELFQALLNDQQTKPSIRQEAYYRLFVVDTEEKEWSPLRTLAEQYQKEFPQGDHAWDARFYAALSDYELRDFKRARPALLELKSAREMPSGSQKDSLKDLTVGDFDWFPSVWVMLAEIGFREKKYDEVSQIVEEFRQADPDSKYLYEAEFVLGRSWKNQAEFEKARAEFQRVVDSKAGKQTETAAKAQFYIGETYFFQKQYKQAVKAYLNVEILYDYPKIQSGAMLGAGMCEEELENWPAAVETYERLLKKFPDSDEAETAKQRLARVRQKVSR